MALAEVKERIDELPRKRGEVVESAATLLAEALVESAQRAESLDDVRRATRAANDAVTVLIGSFGTGKSHLAAFLRSLEQLDERSADDLSDEELEAWGRLRLAELFDEARAQSFSVAELEQRGLSRQRLQQLRSQGRLLGLRLPGVRGYLYPRWQFGRDLRPAPLMRDLLEAADEARLDPLGLHVLMLNPAAGAGTQPAKLLRQGGEETVLGVVRAAGEQGA